MKSVSGYCVRQRRLLSNPVTYDMVTRDHVIYPGLLKYKRLVVVFELVLGALVHQ